MIIWIALFYEADGAVRRIVTPIVKMSIPVMRLVTRVVSIILWPLEGACTVRRQSGRISPPWLTDFSDRSCGASS